MYKRPRKKAVLHRFYGLRSRTRSACKSTFSGLTTGRLMRASRSQNGFQSLAKTGNKNTSVGNFGRRKIGRPKLRSPPQLRLQKRQDMSRKRSPAFLLIFVANKSAVVSLSAQFCGEQRFRVDALLQPCAPEAVKAARPQRTCIGTLA